MFKRNLEKPWTTALSLKHRRLIAVGVAVVCAVTIAAGVHSMRDRAQQDEVELEKQMQAALANVEERYQAGAQRFEDALAKLRLEIRAQGIWNQYGLRPDPASETQPLGLSADPDVPSDGVVTSQATQLRRLDGLLSKRLSEIPAARRLELIVASHDGLWARQFARMPDATDSQTAVTPTSLSESDAQSLWYESGTQQAVAGSGRAVNWGKLDGEIGADEDAARREQRVAIAVHDRNDVVQGALVLVIDVASWAAGLERSRNDVLKVRLMDPSGRALTPDGALELEEDPADGPIIETVLSPLSQPDLHAAARVSRTRQSGHSLSSSPLPQAFGLLLVGLLGAIWAFRLAFPRDRVIRYEMTGSDGPQPTSCSPDPALDDPREETGTAEAPPNENPDEASPRRSPSPETIVLRDWLADVRTCLDRKAATQGLGLEVACEHALPEEVATDPIALGTLLVSVGQDALAAAPNEKIRLTVRSDAQRKDALRFEIDGGGVDLTLAPQAEKLLEQLGGHREFSDASDFSIVLDG